MNTVNYIKMDEKMRIKKFPDAYKVSTYLVRVAGLVFVIFFVAWAIKFMGPLINLAF